MWLLENIFDIYVAQTSELLGYILSFYISYLFLMRVRIVLDSNDTTFVPIYKTLLPNFVVPFYKTLFKTRCITFFFTKIPLIK